MEKDRLRKDSMFAAKNIACDLEPHRRISAFTNNLTALLGLLVLGFPVSPVTIRTMLAGWILVVVASLQFALRRVGPQLRLASIRTICARVSNLSHYA
jgi:uncharacterized membrane protein HdeD (DUF308 family)